MLNNLKIIGSSSEDVSCQYLKNQDYLILARNMIFYGVEIDILCKKWDASYKEMVYYFFEINSIQKKYYIQGYSPLSYLQKQRYQQAIIKWFQDLDKMLSVVICLIVVNEDKKIEDIIIDV